MMYTAVLVGFLMTPIFAGDWNDTDIFEDVSLSSTSSATVTAVSTVSTMTDATANETDIAPSYSPTERPTPKKVPEGEVPPRPSAIGPATTPGKPTTGAKVIVMTTPKPAAGGSDGVGYIILAVLIVIALLAGLVCYVARSRGRRYSVDLTSRPDEAQIPLSTVEPGAPVEPATSNGLQFEGTESSAEPDVEHKAELENVTVEADHPEDQPKQDIPEQSATAPVDPSNEEKTDDDGREGDASNKTSVESLKESSEANENNSNSSVRPQRGAREAEAFWDVPLDNVV